MVFAPAVCMRSIVFLAITGHPWTPVDTRGHPWTPVDVRANCMHSVDGAPSTPRPDRPIDHSIVASASDTHQQDVLDAPYSAPTVPHSRQPLQVTLEAAPRAARRGQAVLAHARTLNRRTGGSVNVFHVGSMPTHVYSHFMVDAS